MLQEIHEQFANSPELSYSGIQSETPIKCDLKKIVNDCWIAWNIELEDLPYYESIFTAIFEGNGLRMTHWVGFSKDAVIVNLEPTLMCFRYIDEYHYETQLIEGNLMDCLNIQCSENEWKNVLTNYLRWLGYVQK